MIVKGENCRVKVKFRMTWQQCGRKDLLHLRTYRPDTAIFAIEEEEEEKEDEYGHLLINQ